MKFWVCFSRKFGLVSFFKKDLSHLQVQVENPAHRPHVICKVPNTLPPASIPSGTHWPITTPYGIRKYFAPDRSTSGTSLVLHQLPLWTSQPALSCAQLRQGPILLFPIKRQERRGRIYEATLKHAFPYQRNQAELSLSKKLGLPMTSPFTLKKAKLWERVRGEDDCAYCPAEFRRPQKGYFSAPSAAFHSQHC